MANLMAEIDSAVDVLIVLSAYSHFYCQAYLTLYILIKARCNLYHTHNRELLIQFLTFVRLLMLL